MVLELSQPLTEMSTRNLPEGKGRSARKGGNLAGICEPVMLENVGAPTSHKSMGLQGLLQGQFYFIFQVNEINFVSL
jgi:hypothetical protein